MITILQAHIIANTFDEAFENDYFKLQSPTVLFSMVILARSSKFNVLLIRNEWDVHAETMQFCCLAFLKQKRRVWN